MENAYLKALPSRASWLAAVLVAGAIAAFSPQNAQAYGDLGSVNNCSALYVLSFKTADVTGAGTDSNIDVTLTGSAPNATKTIRINPYSPYIPGYGIKSDGDSFERNTQTLAALCLDDQAFGYVTQMTVKSDGSYAGAAWALDWVQVQYPNGKTNNFQFDPNQWIEEGTTVTRNSQQDTSGWSWYWHKIAIKTSDQSEGGTDSNIHMTLTGARGATDRIRLNGLLPGNAFERNSTDTLGLWTDKDIGPVTEIKLENDGIYAGTDWHIATIEVTDKNGKVVTFKYNRWLTSQSPPDEQVAFVPLETQPEGKQDYQFVTYDFQNNLKNPQQTTHSEALTYTVSDAIETTSETGYSVGLSASAGWAAGEDGGVEASAGISYERFKNEFAGKAKAAETATSKGVETPISADAFAAIICVWTVPYEVYRVDGGEYDTRVRVLTGQPTCARATEIYSTSAAGARTKMSFSTWHAAMEFYGSRWLDVKRDLVEAGIAFSGVENPQTGINLEIVNNREQPVEVAIVYGMDQLQTVAVFDPGHRNTLGPLGPGWPIVFKIDGAEVGSYVTLSAPKQLYVIE